MLSVPPARRLDILAVSHRVDQSALFADAHGDPPGLDASDDAKARYVLARYAAQNDHFIGHYKTWTKAVNFLIGEQWRSRWDGNSLTWNTEKDIPAWHQQPVTNYTYAVYRSALAKLTKQKPTLEVIPPTGDSKDREAAELADAVLVYLWRLLKKPQKLPIALGWLLVTGMFYLHVGWDPDAGPMQPRQITLQRKRKSLLESDTLPDVAEPDAPMSMDGVDDLEDVTVAADENGDAYKDEQGEPDYARDADLEPQGEICFDVVSPLSVRFNADATSVHDADEFFVAALWPVRKAAREFGVDAKDLRHTDESAETRALYEDLMSASAAGFPRSWQDRTSIYGVSQETAIGDRCLVIEYYSKPDHEYKRGRHWITAGHLKVWPAANKEQAGRADRTKVESAIQSAVDDDTEDDSVVGKIAGRIKAQSRSTGVADENAKNDTHQQGAALDASGDATTSERASDMESFPNGEAPIPFGFWPPLVVCADTPIPGQPSAIGVLSQVVPINEAINSIDGKIAEHHVMMAMGGAWVVATEDAGISITSEPAQIIVSKAFGRRGAAFAPFQAQMHALPPQVYAERSVYVQKLQTVSGVSSLDVPQKAEGTSSGRALLVSQETSDAMLTPTLFAIEGALEEVGRRELIIAREKYREERIIAIRPTDGKWMFRSFRGADLRDGHDVRVQTGSSFPWSKSAQWDARTSLIETVPALYMNKDGTPDEQKLAKLLDAGVPGLEPFAADQNPDLMEIQREHAMFEAFVPGKNHQLPQLAMWQTHVVHLKEHYEFMKRDRARFDRWHPIAQQAFIEHMQLTHISVEQQADAMMGGAPGGQPGGQPPAPGGAPDGGGAQLVPPEAAPAGVSKGPSSLQLTRGDRHAAGIQ